MSVLLFLLIIIGIFVLFIVPEFRRALLTKGTLLLIAFFAVALLSFGAGYLTHFFAADRGYRAEPRLMAAIHFIEGHRQKTGTLPTNEAFKEWSKERGNWFSYDHINGSPDYRIGVWNGDEHQVYNPETHRFHFER